MRENHTAAEMAFRGSPPFLIFLFDPRRRLLFPIASLESLTISLASFVVLSNRQSGTSRRCGGGAFLLKTLSCFNRSAQIQIQCLKINFFDHEKCKNKCQQYIVTIKSTNKITQVSWIRFKVGPQPKTEKHRCAGIDWLRSELQFSSITHAIPGTHF